MIRVCWIPIAVLAAWVGWAPTLAAQQPERTPLHGYVREAATGEPIVMAEVRWSEAAIVATDRNGYFVTPPLQRGPVALTVQAYGYQPLDTVVVAGEGPVTLSLTVAPIQLELLQVRASPRAEPSPQPMVRLIGEAELRQVPPALEPDLLRSLQALPGVAPASPVSSRLLVRGGAPDQNEFLLDGFPVLYPYHLAGAFSAFHMGAVQDVAFWPGAPPARYGGHLSSVVDVQLREGNRERIEGEASLGLVTSSGAVEGPIPGGAGMLALRRTYVDALARTAGSSMPYHFWDVTSRLYVDVSPSDRLTLVAFHGRDRLYREPDEHVQEPPEEEFAWSNGVIGVSWRHLFGGAAVFEQRVSRSVFTQTLDLGRTRIEEAFAGSEHDVDLRTARGDLTFFALPGHTLALGYEASRRAYVHRTGYEVSLAGFEPQSRERSAVGSVTELAAYVEDEISIRRATLRLGLRGERFASHSSLQPRAGLSLPVHETLSLYGWWGRVAQYDHVLQDPDLDLASLYSLDIWLSADESAVDPGTADHFGFGAEVGLPFAVVLRADLYAKRLRDLWTLPEAVDADRRVAIERLEPADARITGLDVGVRRSVPEGLTGWLAYSFLHARTITENGTYPSARQPRHRLVSLLEWRDGPWSFNARMEGFEGLPYTPAVASLAQRPFDLGYRRFSPVCEAIRIEYLFGPRNSARTPWSKRVDLGARYTRDTGGRWSWELGFGLYNALFDPPGIFRPREPALFPPEGCGAPVEVEREPELVLPAVPFLSFRITF